MSIYAYKFSRLLVKKILKEMESAETSFEDACAALCVSKEEIALLNKIAEQADKSLEEFLASSKERHFKLWNNSTSIKLDKDNRVTLSFQLPPNCKIIASVLTVLSGLIGVGQEFVRRELAWSSWQDIYNRAEEPAAPAPQQEETQERPQELADIHEEISVETFNRFGFRGDEEWIKRRADRRAQGEQGSPNERGRRNRRGSESNEM